MRSPSESKDTQLRDPSALFFQADNTRRLIISAYWLGIFLALPLWWSTTSIVRLSLPSSRVTSQAQGRLRFPIRINLETDLDAPLLATQLKQSIDEHIASAPSRWEGHDIYVNYSQNVEKTSDSTYTVVSDVRDIAVRNRRLEYPLRGSTLPQLADILSTLIVPFSSMSGHEHRVAQYSPHYRLAFTLLNENAAAGGSVIGWDISDALSYHISPILTRLSVLHNFTVESQIQFHAPLAFQPRPLDGAFGLTPEDLTVFVNSAEWSLSSSASNDPVLHFILFIPSASRRPLYIINTEGVSLTSNAFLLPQWGGIVIFNPLEQPALSHIQLLSAHLDPIFSLFSNHLLALLGVPRLPPGIDRASTDPSDVVTDWQLDALMRHRALENAKGSEDTLKSIVKLVDQIENMPVGQDVKGDVQGALTAIEKMYASSTISLSDTLHHSASALTLASRAFFNPGMLALLYFPAEHKYAVYTPLFASAVIPLFVAALREFIAWRRQQRQGVTNKH